jgi:two-component system, NtrC family, sensor kinase
MGVENDASWKNDAKFRDLLDKLDVAVLLRRGAPILYVNQALAELTGYSVAELLEMHFMDFVHPDFRSRMSDRVALLERGEIPEGGFECRVNTKSGEERWGEASAEIIDYEGQPTVLGMIHDVTHRHQAETAAREASEMLAQIVQSSPIPTYVINAEHVITHWNRAMEALTGSPAAEMIGTRNHRRPFHRDPDRPAPAPLPQPAEQGQHPGQALAQTPRLLRVCDFIVSRDLNGPSSDNLIREGLPVILRPSPLVVGGFTYDGFVPHAGENGKWMLVNSAPIRDSRGAVVGAIETLQDITERKSAEAGMRASRAELEKLVERRTRQLEQAKATLEADVQRRKQTEQELMGRNSELSELNERLQAAQQQLLQSEKLASVGQLAAGVAHEINNPIGYVQSNLGTLEKYHGDLFRIIEAYEQAEGAIGLEHPAVKAVGQVKHSLDLEFLKEDLPHLLSESKEGVSRVRKIVLDLKDFSRVDSTQEWQWADVHRGLDSTLNIAVNELKYRADVVKHYGDVPEIQCLPSQLNQVFMNLLVNAAQAIDGPRGTIRVSTGREADTAWVAITDSGSGIAPEIVSRIFDPFFTTKPVGKGTGLGLSVSYSIVKKHGGRIEVQSELGKGTTFKVVLPIRHAADETATETSGV